MGGSLENRRLGRDKKRKARNNLLGVLAPSHYTIYPFEYTLSSNEHTALTSASQIGAEKISDWLSEPIERGVIGCRKRKEISSLSQKAG